MKKILLGLGLLLGGTAAGAGGGYALLTLMPDLVGTKAEAGADKAGEADAATALVSAGRVLAPLVYQDGTLAGYGGFQIQVEVTQEKAPAVTARIPVLLHAINMRTFKTPMAAGPDGLIPDLDVLRTTIQQAADESFGKGVVRRVLVTEAAPG